MAFDSKGLDDYVDVAKRIADFRTKHPEGSLQPLNPAQPFDIRELAGSDKNGKEVRGTFIVYTAAAYRSPEDQRPGIGCAYEVFPGRTPYTAGSELQNAETAAWGRAIVAALGGDARAGIASQQEVRNRQAERSGDVFEQSAPARPRPANQKPTRPAAVAAVQAVPEPAAEVDDDAIDAGAQELASEAHNAQVIADLRSTWKRAAETKLLNETISDPGTGEKMPLVQLIDARRREFEDADKALQEFHAAAEAAHMPIGQMEELVKLTTGADFEKATAAQLRQATAAVTQGEVA